MSHETLEALLDWLHQRNPNQPEFIQAAEEILEDTWDLVSGHDAYRAAGVFERLLQPDRVEKELRAIMQGLHRRCCEHLEGDRPDYVRAANRAGISRVARALAAQGI